MSRTTRTRLALVLATAPVVLAVSSPSTAFGLTHPPSWKVLVNEAYRGKLERDFSCSTVQLAIRHLPPTMLPFGSPVLRLLNAAREHAC